MMTRRIDQMKRLVSLYAVVEQMHTTELQRMNQVLGETQAALELEEGLASSVRLEGREALHDEDVVGWRIAERQEDIAAGRRHRLEQMRIDREQLRDSARVQYLASRLKTEQMKRVLDDIEAHKEMEGRRRAQLSSDDRFLGRRRWNDAKLLSPSNE
jgi:hypothetical protein